MNHAVVVTWNDEDQGYFATVPELPGCSAFGETEEELGGGTVGRASFPGLPHPVEIPDRHQRGVP